MAENFRAISIGEMIVSSTPNDVLVAYGLGSCVAICLYDPVTKVGGMLHALLPHANNQAKDYDVPAKFVDSGLPLLLKSVVQQRGEHNRLIVYLCGGAQLISAPNFSDMLKIGQRNVEAAHTALKTARLNIKSQDTGGNAGRTVKLHIDTGQITVKSLGRGERRLN
ncbi:MAG: chemotaxis protein CheD [Anaerolineae bacterium]|nr:chemotaxis protein CheD [Anaerolineae bacterium]